MKSIKNQFLYDLGRAYHAEYRIAIALPQMIKPDTSDELKQAILAHAKEIARHVILLEQIFEWFGQPVDQKLQIAAADGTTTDFYSSLASDADLLAALKMIDKGSPAFSDSVVSSSRCQHEWANLLGNAEGADFLEQILEEEQSAKRSEADRVA